MVKRIIVDSSFPEETRVAFINGTNIEHFEVDTSSNKKQLKGNIYLAKIGRVEPSLQAAFVDFGGNKQGFLPFDEISSDYYKIPHSDKSSSKNEESDEMVEIFIHWTWKKKEGVKSQNLKDIEFKKLLKRIK